MAAPTVSTYTWNPATLQLTIVWSEAVTRGSAWAAGLITLTDIIGRKYSNLGGLGTSGMISGSGTAITSFQMQEDSTVTNAASTVSIAANTVKNAGNEGNGAITAASFYSKVSEATTGLTKYDLDTFIAQFTAVIDDTLDPTAEPQATNLYNASTRLLAYLTKDFRAEDRAYKLLDQLDKFLASSKNPTDYKALNDAALELKLSLNPRGRFVMLSNGL